MNVACDYEAPMQMLTTEKYIAPGQGMPGTHIWNWRTQASRVCKSPCPNGLLTSYYWTII